MQIPRKTVQIIALVVGVIALAPVAYRLTANGLENFLPRSLPLAALVLAAIYCAKCFVMVIPFMALFIAGGALFPTGWAILVTYGCLALELSLGYLLGRRMGGSKVIGFIERNRVASGLLRRYGGQGHALCFLGRILPVPFDLMSMFFGATGVGFWRHLVFSLLGVTPNMAPYVIAGRAISNPMSAEFLVPFGISIAFSAGMFILLRRLTRRKPEEAV